MKTKIEIGRSGHLLVLAGTLTLVAQASAQVKEKYKYDASGNIVEKAVGGKTVKLTYDEANRVTAKESGDRVVEVYTYDAAGRPTVTSDGEGRLVKKMTFGYGDKVIAAEEGGASSGFFYNAEGLLVAKQVGGSISTYAWDGLALAAVGSNPCTNEASGIPLIEGTEVVVSDYLGNTLMAGERAFDPSAYGEGLEQARFTGKPYVKELGGFVFPCRLYSADLGSWTVSDPSGFPDGTNSYAYVSGDPLSRTDPMGLAWEISVAATPPPHLTDTATTGTALTVDGKTTNNVTPGAHPTVINVDYWTKGSGSGLFTSYSGEITGHGVVYCDPGSGNVGAYAGAGSWQRTGAAGAIATNVNCSPGTSAQELIASAKHAATTSGSAGVTGAGFFVGGGAGVSLAWTGGASGIDCTTSCVYKSVEY